MMDILTSIVWQQMSSLDGHLRFVWKLSRRTILPFTMHGNTRRMPEETASTLFTANSTENSRNQNLHFISMLTTVTESA